MTYKAHQPPPPSHQGPAVRRPGSAMSAGQRVFLVDGQAVYLEGDGELTEDVLQQALSQLSSGGQVVQPVEPEPETKPEEQGAAGEWGGWGAGAFMSCYF